MNHGKRKTKEVILWYAVASANHMINNFLIRIVD